ncbi:hypothetical protein So717_21490 [Roseobacter cerasinus]|uniref:Sulfatase N-terminal domain-containing protein n=1 Tax=Roseobacter cerasinus TaxID=2602289 RepID=A0A640VVX1_9RHOB|nr:sulfatase-like hydrolase/transferase [Roseobacter cerasinus]GFE50396.1 hypothetical protein So717_21490 [Roseobacter cerasinus]
MTGNYILFIMCDQLRFGCLGRTGLPRLKTPHINALAARGLRCDSAYVSSPMCEPSWVSTYAGRYVRSHGFTWNQTLLWVGR